MTQSQKEEIAHKMVIAWFLFTKRLAKALNGRDDCMELGAWILHETIQRLEESKNLVKRD